jgi:hypothetical protein
MEMLVFWEYRTPVGIAGKGPEDRILSRKTWKMKPKLRDESGVPNRPRHKIQVELKTTGKAKHQAHAYNPSYSGGRDQEDGNSKSAPGEQFMRLYWKNSITHTRTHTHTHTLCLSLSISLSLSLSLSLSVSHTHTELAE